MSKSTAEFSCRRRDVLLSALAGVGFHSSAQARQDARMALIIGNARYANAPLYSPVNDARLMDDTLRKIGFETDLRTNITLAEATLSVDTWLRKAAAASVRLIFFSGHGAQYRGSSYLLPVDVKLRSEDNLPGAALHVDALIDRFSRFDSGVNLLVLDACRSVPSTLPPFGGIKGDKPPKWTPGIAPMAVPQGTVVAWATAKGAMALDNQRLGNSVFTKHLASYLSVPGLPVEEVLKRTREAVRRESSGTQVPEDTSTLTGQFCFVPAAGGACGKRY
jgi:uncharacterized caspase-like protein